MGIPVTRSSSSSNKSGSKFAPEMQPGKLHNATVTRVRDLGLRESRFGPQQRCIAVTWQNEQGHEAVTFYTPTLNEKSKLRGDLVLIHGEVPESFADMDDLVGTRAEVLAEIKRRQDGTSFTVATVWGPAR